MRPAASTLGWLLLGSSFLSGLYGCAGTDLTVGAGKLLGAPEEYDETYVAGAALTFQLDDVKPADLFPQYPFGKMASQAQEVATHHEEIAELRESIAALKEDAITWTKLVAFASSGGAATAGGGYLFMRRRRKATEHE